MRRGLLIALLGCALSAAAPGAALARFGPDIPFCAPKTLVHYIAPLPGSSSDTLSSRTFHLHPGRVFLSPLPSRSDPWAQLIVGEQSIEYEFYGGPALGHRSVGWTVESSLVRVSRGGRALAVAKHRVEHVARLGPKGNRKVGFAQAPGPGLYRYDLTVLGTKGEKLGALHDYYRVVAEDHDVRLALNGSVFTSGQLVLGKLENYGTDFLFYGVGFSIERYVGTGWERIDEEAVFGHPLYFILIGLWLPPGGSDDCSTGFIVPAGMEPARYRVVKRIDGYPPETVSAEFEVVAAG